jgi:hypothetical protein
MDSWFSLFHLFPFGKNKYLMFFDLFLPGHLGILQEDQGMPLSHANIATPTEAFVLFHVTR